MAIDIIASIIFNFNFIITKEKVIKTKYATIINAKFIITIIIILSIRV